MVAAPRCCNGGWDKNWCPKSTGTAVVPQQDGGWMGMIRLNPCGNAGTNGNMHSNRLFGRGISNKENSLNTVCPILIFYARLVLHLFIKFYGVRMRL
jgi:hypothetical protein